MGFLDSKEKKAGFYSTIIFHLVVIIICLLTAIQKVVSEETSFVLDFSKLEELERVEKQEELKAQASKELDDLLSGNASSSAYRNVAVDRSSRALKDDRFKNPNQVYDEARELQRKLDASRAAAQREQGADEDAVFQDNLPDSNPEGEDSAAAGQEGGADAPVEGFAPGSTVEFDEPTLF